MDAQPYTQRDMRTMARVDTGAIIRLYFPQVSYIFSHFFLIVLKSFQSFFFYPTFVVRLCSSKASFSGAYSTEVPAPLNNGLLGFNQVCTLQI